MIELNYTPAIGRTIEEMRANFENTDMYQMGDAKLVWVNQGDLDMVSMFTKLSRSQHELKLDLTQEEIESMYED